MGYSWSECIYSLRESPPFRGIVRSHARPARKRRPEGEGQGKRESFQRSLINFHFHLGNRRKLQKLSQEMCQPSVRYPHRAKPNTPVMLAFLSKILHNFDKTKRRQYWSGPSGLGCSLQAESDQQYALNSAERCCKAAAFCLNFSFIKDLICYFRLMSKEKCLSTTAMVFLFLRRSILNICTWIWNQLISLWENFWTQQTQWD